MINQNELTIALWRQYRGLVAADQEIHVLQNLQSSRTDWLRFNRKSLLFSIAQAGKLCGVSRAAFDQLEKREITGQITLAKLRATADALGCELVYLVRPRDGKTFAQASWARLADEVEVKAARQICLPHMRARLNIAIARHLLESQKNLKRYKINRRRR